MIWILGSFSVQAQEPTPVDWFLDQYPIPKVTDPLVRTLRFYDNRPTNRPEDGTLAAAERTFLLRKADTPLLEMRYDSLGRLVHAIAFRHLRPPERDTFQLHLRQVYNDAGRLAVQVERVFRADGFTAVSTDSTYYLYHPNGRLFAVRKPHAPWMQRGDTIRGATDKYSRFRYRRGRLVALEKRCDPASDRPSGMLVECARDSFLYDGAGRIAEILNRDVAGWEPVRHFLYDAQGQLKETAIYAGKNPYWYVRWSYDSAGRPRQCVREPAASFDPPAQIFRFWYSPEGQMTRFQARRAGSDVETDLLIEAE
ncbi:MAG: hypothetical protein AAGN35_24960 [Bacteroidota bacterium]